MALRFWTGVLAAGFLASQTAVADTDYDSRWYVAPGVGLVFMDSDRGVDGGSLYTALSFGRFFSPDFSLDLRLDRYNETIGGAPSGEGRFKLESYGVVGRYHFPNYSGASRPYLLAALGIQEHDSIFGRGRDAYAGVGVGFSHALTDRVSMRLETEARYDNDRDSLDRSRGFWDFIFTSSLKVRLGAAPAAPAPEPERRPTPPPPPPPPPPPAPAPEPEPEVLFEFDAMVTFGLDSADLRPGAVAELNEAAGLLNLHPEITRIEVAGHTCDLGPAAHNQRLSERRAQAVRDFLVNNGVSADRLVVRGYGEDRPKLPNTSDSNRQQNRRVELVVLERADR